MEPEKYEPKLLHFKGRRVSGVCIKSGAIRWSIRAFSYVDLYLKIDGKVITVN